LYIYYTTIII